MLSATVSKMTRNQLNSILAAVLTTAMECQPCPESAVYLALDCDMSMWADIRNIMVAGQLITTYGHSITLTAKGREIAEKCNQALAAR